jgi:hypothetical protein
LAAKIKHCTRGTDTTRRVTRPFQGFSIDFAFAGQRSKDKNTAVDLVGYGGETCYVLLVDHFTEKLYGATRISKVPPVAWLQRFLLQHVPEDDPKNDRYIFLDQDLLKKEFFFELCPTGTQAHHQNGLVERPIETIDDAIRCMLWGGCLLISYWPFAFTEYLAIKNAALPRQGATMSGDEKSSGKRTNLSHIHTFGCRVWVKHTSAKSKKYNVDTKKGRHLGHMDGGTKKNSLWVDDATGRVKLGYHLLSMKA